MLSSVARAGRSFGARAFCGRAAPLITSSRVPGEKGEVALLRVDDGKMNAFSSEMIKTWHAELDAAESSHAVVVVGNAKCFSAGFDLSVMGKGPSPAAGALLREGLDLAKRLLEYPRPLVMGVTGHSLALGAIIMSTADFVVGTSNPKAKIGTNEVHIGMPLPASAFPIMRAKLASNHLRRAATLGHMYGPEEALAAGYFDALAPPDEVEARALALAAQLAHLGAPGQGGHGFRLCKLYERRAILEEARALEDQDVALFSAKA